MLFADRVEEGAVHFDGDDMAGGDGGDAHGDAGGGGGFGAFFIHADQRLVDHGLNEEIALAVHGGEVRAVAVEGVRHAHGGEGAGEGELGAVAELGQREVDASAAQVVEDVVKLRRP